MKLGLADRQWHLERVLSRRLFLVRSSATEVVPTREFFAHETDDGGQHPTRANGVDLHRPVETEHAHARS
jgi:hypothetical protein